MPLYEYTCAECQVEVEILVRGEEAPECPKCGSKKLEKLWSVPAAHSSGELPVAGETCGRPQCGMGGCQGF